MRSKERHSLRFGKDGGNRTQDSRRQAWKLIIEESTVSKSPTVASNAWVQFWRTRPSRVSTRQAHQSKRLLLAEAFSLSDLNNAVVVLALWRGWSFGEGQACNCHFCPEKAPFRACGVIEKHIWRLYGGGGGIRTPGTLSGPTVFKTAGFNRSPTPPVLPV